MKRIGWRVLIGIFLLSACDQTTAVPAIPSVTLTPSIPSTSTQTDLPLATPTASITPLPTLPTFTPTFDVSTILTVTPAPQAECPEIDSTIKTINYFPEKIEYPSPRTTGKILDFLNKGGDGQALIARFEQIYPNGGDYRGGYGFYDITGDQSPELLYV
jgi:hypothetical protein